MTQTFRLAYLLLVFCFAARPSFSQASKSPVWLAGRYDQSSVVVYFQAVRFNNTFPPDAQDMTPPVADAFFTPRMVRPAAVTAFQHMPEAEHFAIGDRYDLLLGNGRIGTITLTSLVAFESDEQVGNDSYIGALGAVAANDLPLFIGNYFVVRRHTNSLSGRRTGAQAVTFSRLVNDPIPLDVRGQITRLVRRRMSISAKVSPSVKNEIKRAQPSTLRVQPFKLPDGILRYHVWAQFRLKGKCLAESAWIDSQPLRVAAMEDTYCRLEEFVIEPQIRQLVDLGDDRVGLVVEVTGGDGRSLDLLKYRRGVGLSKMRKLQSVAAGE